MSSNNHYQVFSAKKQPMEGLMSPKGKGDISPEQLHPASSTYIHAMQSKLTQLRVIAL
jgi:hypothetical protein